MTGTAGLDLHLQVGNERLGELLEKRVRKLGLLEEEALDEDEALRATSLHHVRSQGEGRAREADHGDGVGERAARAADGFGDEARRLLWVRHAEARHVCSRPQRVREMRPLVPEFELHPHRLHRDEDVREDDGRVDAEAGDGLDRHLGR